MIWGKEVSSVRKGKITLVNIWPFNKKPPKLVPVRAPERDNSEKIDEAERRIRKAAEASATTLHLNGLGLTQLPESLWKLSHLKNLDIHGNRLTNLPESIGQLSQLRFLSIRSNDLVALPESLCELNHLETLYFDGPLVSSSERNKVTSLPKGLGNLKSLRDLSIAKLQLESLPEFIGQLIKLQSLDVSGNRLTALPEFIGQLSELQILDVSDNALNALPESLGKLTKLQNLNASKNRLTSLPESMQRLKCLSSLILHDNNGIGIPIEILDSQRLEVEVAMVGENRSIHVPATPESILDYYFRTRRDKRPLNEAKLIIVGRGGVGKTCLIQRLLHDSFDKDEPETPGINIQPWEVKLACGDQVRLHVWDFGGQRILHGTHQFFLTERTLYLLVLSGREDSATPDAEYWLQLIRSFGGQSRVLIALNKQHEHPFDVNRGLLMEKYPFIAGFLRTDCADGFGLAELKQRIYAETDALEHRKTSFPADWFKIKERLASMPENFIDWEGYQKICRDLGEHELQAQRDLAKFLHILGIALNYAEDPRLHDTRVLKPTWVTDGIYSVLRALQKETTGGVLRLADLSCALDATNYPPSKHDFLLRLMEKFQLCFRMPGQQERYLVPELLGENQPDIKSVLDVVGLGFRYQYEILPEGLLPRFIVQTHSYSEPNPHWRWRTGVVLDWSACRAVVRADHRERRVDIHVTGPEGRRRELLAVVRASFEEQHRDLKGLKVDERVPIASEPGVTVSYRDLLQREEDGEEEYRPEGAKQKVRVTELLNGVERPELRKRRRTIEKAIETAINQVIEHHHHYPAGATPEFKGVDMGHTENVGGNKITITNSTLTNCFNTIQQMPGGNVKVELEKLAKLVDELLKQAPAEAKEKAQENLETLVKQATKPVPDKRWFDLSAEGLKEAAQTVVGMAPQVIAVLDNLRGYLRL